MIEKWQEAWPKALALWSDFVQLREPKLCATTVEAAKENLTMSFAMIRLNDQQVVVNLEGVAKYGLEDYSVEILAHEIGHHVFSPANLTDFARMLAIIRRALPSAEKAAPMVANLYADLLINDHLQRFFQLRMADVYKKMRGTNQDPLWQLYMRVYEILWNLDRETLTVGEMKPEIEGDALLVARMIRGSAQDQLRNAGSFANLILLYLNQPQSAQFQALFDMEHAAGGDELPGGLTEEIDEESVEGFPAEDARAEGNNSLDGKVRRTRNIIEYKELMETLGSKKTSKQIVVAYYRELASKYLIPFPEIVANQSVDLQSEGLEVWDPGAPIENIDWFQTVLRSPTVIPGVTTVERVYSEVRGFDPKTLPVNLYIGIDCSGSMGDPSLQLSYPVLAGTILARSALRAGASVMGCLSGEPGNTIATEGFLRDENKILELLTDYLGSGRAFGIHWLWDHIVNAQITRPTHVLIVTDQDIFDILDSVDKRGQGWNIAKHAVAKSRAGGTMILRMHRTAYPDEVKRLENMGWTIFTIRNMEDIIQLAQQFSRQVYSKVKDKR